MIVESDLTKEYKTTSLDIGRHMTLDIKHTIGLRDNA